MPVVNKILRFVLWATLCASLQGYAQYNFSLEPLEGQTPIEVPERGSYRKAKKLLFKDNYIVALPYLEKVIAKWKTEGKNTDKLTFQLGICYVVSKSPSKGLYILDSLEKINPRVHPDLIYWKGLAYHYSSQYDKAIEYYNKALHLFSVTGEEKNDIRKKIKECESGKLLSLEPKDYEVVNAGSSLNTMFSEHSPTLENDSKTLYFTSRKNIDGQNATFTGEYFEDIYMTKLDSNVWQKPVGQTDFNTKEHDACSQITNGNNTMIMYRSTKNGDIYRSEKQDGQWTHPKVIKGLNSMSYESSAFLTKDGNRIYFSSNKFSDQGDLDLYYMDKISEGKWGRPKGLGSHINTAYNEDGIFISDDGNTLYFSSQGHNSIGGFDVFRSEWDGSKWGKPTNMGTPINSPSDDIYYSISANKKYAIFSSYRDGGLGMRDLYLCVPTDKVLAKITLVDSLTKTVVDGEVTLQLKASAGTLLEEKLPAGRFEKEIKNRERYELSVLKGDILLYKDTLSAKGSVKAGLVLEKSIVVAYHKLPPKEAPKKDTSIYDVLKVKEDADTAIINKEHIFGNIYFEHNHSKITKRYFEVLYELIKVMKENPEIVIEVQGFADDDGDLEYNKSLSELRAHNVYDFLTSRGISRKRIIYKGYGQTKQFNQDHKENRRARFVKINK